MFLYGESILYRKKIVVVMLAIFMLLTACGTEQRELTEKNKENKKGNKAVDGKIDSCGGMFLLENRPSPAHV